MFRSRSLLVYGPVRSVDELGPRSSGDALVAAITAAVRDDLAELLVEGATWPERLLIARVAEMLTNDSGDRSLERWNTIGRQVEAARKALRGGGGGHGEGVGRAVGRYYERLEEEGLADEQLAPGGDLGPVDTARRRRACGSPAARRRRRRALRGAVQLTRLAASPHRGRGGRALDLQDRRRAARVPGLGGGLAGAGFVLLPPPLAAAFGAVVVASPFAALAWHDAVPRLRRAVRLAARERRIAELRALRAEAMTRILAARERLAL